MLRFLIFPTFIFPVLGAPISDLSNFYISSAWCRRHSIWLCDLSLEMRSQEGVCHLPQGFSIQKVFFSLTSYIAAGLHKHSRRPWGGRTCKAGEVSFCIILDVAGDTAADVKESESNSGRKEGGCHKSSSGKIHSWVSHPSYYRCEFIPFMSPQEVGF